MSSEKPVLAEVRVLCARMRGVFVRKDDLQHAPTLSVLMPRFNLLHVEAWVGIDERRCEVTPKRVTAEIAGMQFVPFGIGGLPGKSGPWVDARVEGLSRLRLQGYLVRGEHN